MHISAFKSPFLVLVHWNQLQANCTGTLLVQHAIEDPSFYVPSVVHDAQMSIQMVELGPCLQALLQMHGKCEASIVGWAEGHADEVELRSVEGGWLRYLCMQIAFKLVRILQTREQFVGLQGVLGIQKLAALGYKRRQAADALNHCTDTLQLRDLLAFLWGQWSVSLLQQFVRLPGSPACPIGNHTTQFQRCIMLEDGDTCI